MGALMTVRAGFVLVAMAPLFVGCNEDKKAGKVADNGGDSTGGDSDSGSCSEGEIVDGRGICRTVCEDNGPCSDAEACNVTIGFCLPTDPGQSCDPAACEQGFICPDNGDVECVPGPGYCAEDGDCSFGERCDAGRCVSRAGDVVQTCTTDADCGPLMACSFGVCTGCLDDIQCAVLDPDAQCVFGTCVVADLGPAGDCIGLECPEGERCNLTTGLCEPTCTNDEDCGDAEVCAPVLNRCVADPGCVEDEDCPGELTCEKGLGLETGVCFGCGEGVPCGEGLACVLGACLPDLNTDSCRDVECLEGELCDPLDGACYPEDGSCDGAEDCREGFTCNFLSLCQGCSVDGDCRPDQRCVLGACVRF